MYPVTIAGKSRSEADSFYWGDSDADGRIVLRWLFRKWDVEVWTGSSWLRIEIGGGRL
jgi:hypothetical protein